MLRWAAVFLVVAIIAAILGFTCIAGAAADYCQIPFLSFPSDIRGSAGPGRDCGEEAAFEL